ncbi:MAG: NTP transferase domain-containing protein, partial [Planctomycetota bacterium]
VGFTHELERAYDQALQSYQRAGIVGPDGRGPLEGLAAGLDAIAPDADAALAIGCDTPLVEPAVVRLLMDRLATREASVAVAAGQRQPLLAVYRTCIASRVHRLLAEGRQSLMALLDACDAVETSEEMLRGVDPPLHSLLNCNTPNAYRLALETAGYNTPGGATSGEHTGRGDA